MIDLEIDKLCEFTYVMKDNSYSVCYAPNSEKWVVVNYREPLPQKAGPVIVGNGPFSTEQLFGPQTKQEPMTIAAGGTIEECFDWIRNAIQS